VYAFAVGHPLNGANKRTALAVGDLILLMNDQEVIRPEYQIELADHIVALAAGKFGRDQFVERYIELLERGGENPEPSAPIAEVKAHTKGGLGGRVQRDTSQRTIPTPWRTEYAQTAHG